MTGLTRKQHDLLLYIDQTVRETGIPPAFTEMASAMGLKSKSGIHRLTTALEERGYIRRLEKRARAIEVLRLPENLAARQAPAHSRQQMHRYGVEGRAKAQSDGAAVMVPMVGCIAGFGTPIEALQNRVGDIATPGGMIGRGGHYALEVVGDSMINAGILDGDTVIICETDKVSTGTLAVVLVDNECAFLRRIRFRGETIALEPANPHYENRIFPAHRVVVQGRMVGLVRRY